MSVLGSTTTGRSGTALTAAVLVAGLLGAPLLALVPTAGAVLSAGALVVLSAALWPGAVLTGYVAVLPWLVGLGRGAVVPGLRLNEALLAPVLLGVAIPVLHRWWRSGLVLPRGFHPLDGAVVATAAFSSVTPLLWMYANSREVTLDDVLYALALWKLAVLYAACRVVIRSRAAARQVLVAIVVSAGLIGSVGLAQAIGFGPVLSLLAALVPPEEGGYSQSINRATATIGNPIAYGDLLVYATVIAAAAGLTGGGSRARRSVALAGVLALFALASGQISVVIALLVALCALGVVTGRAARVAAVGAGVVAVAALALQPVLAARVSQIEPGSVLPQSWVGRYGRLDNLQRFFWPEIGADYNWVFGVRTSSRVPGPERWREWIYIESGYTWALWNGGLLLLVSILVLLLLGLRAGLRVARHEERASRVLGFTVVAAVAALTVVLLFDPHLTLRGAADALFVLLALTATADGLARLADPLPGGPDRPAGGEEHPLAAPPR